ncbi:MAG: hypothetical protein EXQ99_06210 [Alphaproteobacteria bacterium]|nr:hypothetical protein [Alphaproteobacteria bacterium]
MHQHAVIMSARQSRHLARAIGLAIFHQDVAHRAQKKGSWRCRTCRRDQGHQLEAELATPERKHLGNQNPWAKRVKNFKQMAASSCLERLVDRLPASIDEMRKIVIRGAHRLKLHELCATKLDRLWVAPPDTSVTSIPSALSARAMADARFKCPMPSKC